MGRWLLLSFSVFVLGAVTVVNDPARAPDARDLGGLCEDTHECRSGSRCVDAAGVIEGQCSATCSESISCQSQFGAKALCLGADLCARTCAHDTDCPDGTDCNLYGWCERPRN
jgi:hypothetical protein